MQLEFLDNVGTAVIDNIFGLILDTPANLALVDAIATSPAFTAINGAQAGVSAVLGPFERALLVCLDSPLQRYSLSRDSLTALSSQTFAKSPSILFLDMSANHPHTVFNAALPQIPMPLRSSGKSHGL